MPGVRGAPATSWRVTRYRAVAFPLGCATARKGDTLESLIARADASLYAAQRKGRNRVICETDPEFAAAAAKVA